MKLFSCFIDLYSNDKCFILGGVIRLTEVALMRPILWDVCLLHNNELPFKVKLGSKESNHFGAIAEFLQYWAPVTLNFN